MKVTLGSYKIVRSYRKGGKRVIRRNLTLEQAQSHCADPETSSRTATSVASRKITKRVGAWFDGYTSE